jgi:hypothetical protein
MKGVYYMYSINELKKASTISRFRFDPTKQEISRRWNELRKIDQATYIDLSNPLDILNKYKQVESLIIKAFQQDQSSSIKYWLNDMAIAFGSTQDKLSRNIWLDLKECYILLVKKRLIKK